MKKTYDQHFAEPAVATKKTHTMHEEKEEKENKQCTIFHSMKLQQWQNW